LTHLAGNPRGFRTIDHLAPPGYLQLPPDTSSFIRTRRASSGHVELHPDSSSFIQTHQASSRLIKLHPDSSSFIRTRQASSGTFVSESWPPFSPIDHLAASMLRCSFPGIQNARMPARVGSGGLLVTAGAYMREGDLHGRFTWRNRAKEEPTLPWSENPCAAPFPATSTSLRSAQGISGQLQLHKDSSSFIKIHPVSSSLIRLHQAGTWPRRALLRRSSILCSLQPFIIRNNHPIDSYLIIS
jgi:hypothetical protein